MHPGGPMVPAVVVLALSGAGLLLAGAGTAVRPARPVPDRAAYLDRWQELHGGFDPRSASVLVRGWLTVAFRCARPLARAGVQPDVVTLASLWLAGLVVALARSPGHWPLLGGLLLVLSGLLDSLDGCVAVLEDRTTAWGYVLDSVVDRLSDAAYLLAAVALGAPVGLAVGCGLAVFLLEYLRARAGNAGGDEVGRVTVGERPARIILLSAALLAAGTVPASRGVLAGSCVAVLAALTAAGLVQLVVAVRRQLTAPPIVPGP